MPTVDAISQGSNLANTRVCVIGTDFHTISLISER